MAIIPITLVGDNLGQRHRYLNKLVDDAFKKGEPFESIRDLPEATPVDRLFKIDLAAKVKNIDYLIKCLKDHDMLYVSRAIKSLEFNQGNIFTPRYLEEELYPEMLMSGSNKMKHYIALKLRDKDKCREFYEYYKDKKLKYALTFFPKCAPDYIVNNLDQIPFSKMTPQFTKLLCESTTIAAENLFKIIKKSEQELLDGNYNTPKDAFMSKMQILLKSAPNQFFYLIENFCESRFKRLNKKATKIIMKFHRSRFEAKRELYAARFLHTATLSKFLSNDEIKDLITQLARSEYLEGFRCNYKFAEPLLKRMDKKEKPEFCKKIFEDQNYGEVITIAPYFIPTIKYTTKTIKKYDYYLDHEINGNFRCMLKCRKGGGRHCFQRQTKLDKLFDQYRFKGFEKTFIEFKNLIPKESELENRQNMFLVLVSKTGRRVANLSSLIEYLIQKHSNEPVSLRATIVRSLMKRACAWRMPAEDWSRLLTFGHDLGLDGSDPLAPCTEGLHGVILHDILNNGVLSSAILNVFLREYVPLNNYFLTYDEKQTVVPCLLTMLLNDAKVNIELAPKRLHMILDTLNAYALSLKQYPEVISAIKDTVSRDTNAFRDLLERVYKLKIARQVFFNENFEIIQKDESFVNALKIDTRVLQTTDKFEKLLDVNGAKQLQNFLRKLVVYFGEKDGLAKLYLNTTKHKLEMEKTKSSIAKTFVLLAYSPQDEIFKLIGNMEKKNEKKLVAALWASIHLARPRPFITFMELKDKSRIATANYIQKCSPLDLKEKLPIILLDPRLARQVLALRAPVSKGLIAETLPIAATCRSTLVLQIALRILRYHTDAYGKEDWNVLTHLIDNIDLKKKTTKMYLCFAKIDTIPEQYKIDYCLAMYQALARAELGSDNGPSYSIVSAILPCIGDNLGKADSSCVSTIITTFLKNNFLIRDISSKPYKYTHYVDMFVEIIIKFITLTKSDNDKNDRIQNIARAFLRELKKSWNDSEESRRFLNTFVEPLSDLRNDFHGLDEFMTLILEFYEEMIPMEKYVEIYLKMRFTILLRQALRQCILEEPKLFQSDTLDKKDTLNLLGEKFATLVKVDLCDVTSKSFDSIVVVYSEMLCNFISNMRTHWHNEWDCFKLALVKNLLQDSNNAVSSVLGVLLCVGDSDAYLKGLITKIEDSRVKMVYSTLKY